MKHLSRDLARLEQEILAVGGMVEEQLRKATAALIERRTELSDLVVAGDARIDAKEVEVEEECLKVLALHQPVAGDLRFLVAVLKVNNDLERMGDLAVNVAERARELAEGPPLPPVIDLPRMVGAVRGMVAGCLDALVRRDPAAARAVCERDDEVDALYERNFASLQELMERDPGAVRRAIHALSASRHLERIADLATNIAEDVVFMVEGDVIRHGAARRRAPAG